MDKRTLYLQYIKLYLDSKDDDAGLLRTFLDNWFAYKRGVPFLKKTGRPKWFNNPNPQECRDALLEMHFVSRAARRVIDGYSRKHLVKDHAVPVKELQERMRNECFKSTDELETFLDDYYALGVITKDEDKKLNKLRLRSTMPSKRWGKSSKYDRYKKAEIERS